jgi:predicted signal transduction protein with EAL and GGDEF domain
MLRMLASVALAIATFVIVRSAAGMLSQNGLVGLAIAAAASLITAGIGLMRTVGPLLATQSDLQVRYEAALADALRDPLTGLGNHRAFHEELDRQVAAALRYELPLALLLIDLDEFKSIND